MNVALRKVMTVEEYLAWADAQPERSRTELINGQIVAMAPERVGHVEAKLAAVIALKTAIARAGLPCHALTDGVAVKVDDHTAYEPDALVYCGAKLPGHSMIVPNPVIVVEVLSPTTAHTDTSAKLVGYFKLSSVYHYLIINVDLRTVTHHARGADGPRPGLTLRSGILPLDPPGLEIEIPGLFE
jgi:Uma2 family endonuclease